MKVLYVCSTEQLYGDNKALLNLLPNLESLGVKPLFLVKGKFQFYSYLKEHGYIVFSYTGFYAHALGPDKALKQYAWWVKTSFIQNVVNRNTEIDSLVEILSKEDVNLIHTNNGICTLGYELAKKLNIPHVWHIREYIDKDANYRFMPSKHIYCTHLKNGINYTITITDGVKKHFNLCEKSSTVYDGVFDTKELPLIEYPKSDYFLYVGRLAEGKRVLDAIEAFGMFKKKNKNSTTRLLIAGDGNDEYKSLLNQKVKEYCLDTSIVFLGYRTDVPKLMSKAKALIVPSQFEAFGFITAEAMFYGCPVIGRNTGGTKEQMDNVDNAIGENICLRFLNNKELAERLATIYYKMIDKDVLCNIQHIVSDIYPINKSAQKVFDIYNKILNL